MKKFYAALLKDLLVLARDKAGLLILFVMPLVLIIVVTLIQDTTYKSISEFRISLLFVDNDGGELGTALERGLIESGVFNIVKKIDGKPVTPESARKAVSTGKYQIAITIPYGATEKIQKNSISVIKKILTGFSDNFGEVDSVKIGIFLDPVLKQSYKNAAMGFLGKYCGRIESQIALASLGSELGNIFPGSGSLSDGLAGIVSFEEIIASEKEIEKLPTSVQHNVPAWTLFAMFFIVIPMTSNIIKEREDGCLARLKSMPAKPYLILFSKITVYIIVCILQFILMLFVGTYILPLFGLPGLQLDVNYSALFISVVVSALAATGYGMLVGSAANTHQQAAAFGAVSVIILAAIGGVWVPDYAMPEIMRKLSVISPISWGLDAFYDIFLRKAGTIQILPFAAALTAFSAACLTASLFINKLKRN